MTHYNMLSVKLSNSQFSLKSGIKHGTEVTLNLSSNLTWNSNDATNFSDKLLLTHTQVQRFITIHNDSSAKTKFQKLNCLRWYSQEDLFFICLVQIKYRLKLLIQQRIYLIKWHLMR